MAWTYLILQELLTLLLRGRHKRVRYYMAVGIYSLLYLMKPEP